MSKGLRRLIVVPASVQALAELVDLEDHHGGDLYRAQLAQVEPRRPE